MESFFEKIGIYDLLAVFLSGACIILSTVCAWSIALQIPLKDISIFFTNDYSLMLVVASYFVGLVFQEIGSFVYKNWLCPNDTLLKKALNTFGTTHEHLTEVEKETITEVAKRELGISCALNDTELYAYCRSRLIFDEKMGKANQEQAIAAMSRSLSLHFIFLSVLAFCWTLLPSVNQTAVFLIAVASVVLSLLLRKRCLRFIEMRYIEILRGFYCDVTIKGQFQK